MEILPVDDTLQNTCLQHKEYDGACGDHLVSFCGRSGGVEFYFEYFGACLERDCVKDEDRYGMLSAQ